MKKRIVNIVKTLLLIAGAFCFIMLLFSWLDSISNGVILNSVAEKFSYTTSFTDDNGTCYVSQMIDWQSIKFTALYSAIVLTCVIIVVLRTIMGLREKKLKEKLSRKEWELDVENQKKNELITYLAHDLRTPLTSVIGYLSLLTEAPDMPMEQRVKYTKIGLDKALRLESLIDEFFDITRYNLQEIEIEKESVNLSYLITQLTDEFYPLLKQGDLSINLDAPDNVILSADPEKLARVFNNILKNAITYSTPGTEIQMTLKQNIDNTVVTVSNTGKTIPKEKLSRIFEKFYRLDEARATNTGGAGLGLAIAKEIVTRHGGEILAESLNGKTTFTVILPQKQS